MKKVQTIRAGVKRRGNMNGAMGRNAMKRIVSNQEIGNEMTKIAVHLCIVCWLAKFRWCAIWEAVDEAFITPTQFCYKMEA